MLKNILRGKMTTTTSSVVFAVLTIMLCQQGSTMKCTGVWRAMGNLPGGSFYHDSRSVEKEDIN